MVKKLANNSHISCVLNCRIKGRNVLVTQPFSFPLDIFFIHYNSVVFLTVEHVSQPQNFSYFLKVSFENENSVSFFVLSCVFHSFTVCFNLIHSPFFLFHFLSCLPSPLSPFNLMCSFFFFNYLILLSAACMVMGITYIHLVKAWRPSLGLSPNPKKQPNKTTFPSSSSHQLPITSQLGVGLCELFPIPGGILTGLILCK